ncbi:MAG: O-antigen ligase domain-containing protein, partial [Chitinophagaceae bacterium]
IYITEAVKLRALALYSVITTVASIFCLGAAMLIYLRTGDAGFLYNDSLSDAIGKQSVYFALMINIAIFSYGYLLVKQYLSRTASRMAVAAICFLVIIHFMLASRMEIIFLYSTAILYTMYHFFIKKKNRKTGFIMIGAMVACALVFMLLFPKTINRFNELGYPQYNMHSDAAESHYNMKLTAEQWNGFNIRLAIWNCAWPLIESQPLMGTGLGDKDKDLQNQFVANDFKFGIRTNKNMHSTYLDVMSSMGIIGLLIFLAGFVLLPMRQSVQAKDLIGILILVDLSLSFLTETYPDRSMGNVLLGFFVAFICCYKGQSNRARKDTGQTARPGSAKILYRPVATTSNR